MAYYLIFIISALFSAISGKWKLLSTILIILSLTIFAGTRLDIDNDYLMYYKNLYYVEDSIKDFSQRSISMEWCMYIIPHFYELFSSNKLFLVRASLLTFAFLGVSTKLFAIKKYALVFSLSILLYCSNLFLMMEMTTIRAGVAAGIFLLAINDLEEKNHKAFFLKILLCFLFHNTSILFVIAWFLLRLDTRIKYYYFAIFISLIFAFAKINILKVLFLDRIFPRIDIYFKMMEWQRNEGTNIFSFRSIFAIGIIILFGIYYKKLQHIKYFENLFRIHIISVCLFFLLSPTAEAFSIRTFEMFSVVQILLYPMIIYIFNKKIIFFGWLVIILYSLLQIYYLINMVDIYQTYKSWIFD
ncbi:MAG: EpsG family protein [Weeksellaceae bacterium]|nr:EpsG family protein [Weeksellaceae bacterium]